MKQIELFATKPELQGFVSNSEFISCDEEHAPVNAIEQLEFAEVGKKKSKRSGGVKKLDSICSLAYERDWPAPAFRFETSRLRAQGFPYRLKFEN